jgi:hypothetical protein
MTPKGCLRERLFSLSVAITLLAAGAVMAVAVSVVVPFVGLIAAGPILFGAWILYNRARHGECPL